MENIFYSIIKSDCQEISSSLNENGLLEFTIPKNCTDEEFSKYFRSLGTEEHSKIADKQKKSKEVFRKKVNKMIDKYRKEFDLPFMIDLRIQSKTQKINDCNGEFHGWVYESNLMIISILQYFPDELVEKIIRYTVYLIACQYEESYSKIKYMSVGALEFPDGEESIKQQYEVPEEAKYHVSVPYSKIKKMETDYKAACNQFSGDLKKHPIHYIQDPYINK